MPRTGWGWLITADELQSWITEETDELLVINKPAHVVCHPSKHGPWSSLIGACRELLGAERTHLPYRLDRETSGVMLVTKERAAAVRFHKAVTRRAVHKTYLAILCGELQNASVVSKRIARETGSEFVCVQRVVEQGGQPAETEFVPIAHGGGYTLARVHPRTGRLHQIRVHAASIGHPVAGDKLYPDASLMLEFMRDGFSQRLQQVLPIDRQALHCAEVRFETGRGTETFGAPLAPDLAAFLLRISDCGLRAPQNRESNEHEPA